MATLAKTHSPHSKSILAPAWSVAAGLSWICSIINSLGRRFIIHEAANGYLVPQRSSQCLSRGFCMVITVYIWWIVVAGGFGACDSMGACHFRESVCLFAGVSTD